LRSAVPASSHHNLGTDLLNLVSLGFTGRDAPVSMFSQSNNPTSATESGVFIRCQCAGFDASKF